MKVLRGLALALGLVISALVALYFVMAERVEVVVLHSHDARGEHETRLWVVDHGGRAWLRTSKGNASWLPRLRASPGVELERGGERRAFTAALVTEPEVVARINELTLEKYGWSERLLRAVGAGAGGQVAIRLDPRRRATSPNWRIGV